MAKALWIPEDKNWEYIILVITNAYGIKTDKVNMRLVIKWDLCILFDLII